MQAGKEAVEHGITREDQDRWALRSQRLYAEALANRKFNDEIIPVALNTKKGGLIHVVEDEGPRPDTSLEKLSGLPLLRQPHGNCR